MTPASQKSSVLLLSVAEILRTDLKNFLFIFIFLLLAFYLALYFLYPRSGSALLRTAPSFNDPITGAQALVELAFYGANAEIKLREIFDSEVMNWMSSTNAVLWVMTYIAYTLIALICLLNLLIAMLSETFGKVQEEATLKFRVAFARSVLKFEMTARYFYREKALFAGERTPQVCASLYFPHLCARLLLYRAVSPSRFPPTTPIPLSSCVAGRACLRVPLRDSQRGRRRR